MCPHCKVQYHPTEAENIKIKEHLGPIIDENIEDLVFYHGTGCDKCRDT
ncbi:MAG: hypothetical protein ACPHY8_00980 [Patescibacteria group bacterium]